MLALNRRLMMKSTTNDYWERERERERLFLYEKYQKCGFEIEICESKERKEIFYQVWERERKREKR